MNDYETNFEDSNLLAQESRVYTVLLSDWRIYPPQYFAQGTSLAWPESKEFNMHIIRTR